MLEKPSLFQCSNVQNSEDKALARVSIGKWRGLELTVDFSPSPGEEFGLDFAYTLLPRPGGQKALHPFELVSVRKQCLEIFSDQRILFGSTTQYGAGGRIDPLQDLVGA